MAEFCPAQARRSVTCITPPVHSGPDAGHDARTRTTTPEGQLRRQTVKHIKWDEIPYEKVNDRFLRKLAWDGKVMIALTEVQGGYEVPAHSHPNEQVTWVFSGKWRFHIEGKVTDVGPGEMIFIPADVVHRVEALETLVAYDIFTPPREDWLTGSDSYLRG